MKDPNFLEVAFWRIQDFFESWIFPAYKIKRLLHRKDIIKLEGVKPTEWCDEREQMLLACKAIVKSFLDQKPEEIVCYYKDEEGKDVGPRIKSEVCPEIDGRYFFDVFKDIAHMLLEELPELDKDINAVMSLMLLFSPTFKFSEGSKLDQDFSRCPKDLEESKKLVLEKCTEDEIARINKLVDFGKLEAEGAKTPFDTAMKLADELEAKKSKLIKKALHWLVEAREDLWI